MDASQLETADQLDQSVLSKTWGSRGCSLSWVEGGSGHLAGGLRVKWEWGLDGQVTKAGEDLPTEVEEADWEMGLGCRPLRM